MYEVIAIDKQMNVIIKKIFGETAAINAAKRLFEDTNIKGVEVIKNLDDYKTKSIFSLRRED